ncbi:PH domain-containing protein [Microbacterium luticocti]|uniref:PH domain-containing protein n=1 Tax=Microbacterium luticocti TaxID=451764 RepID=UPI0003FC04D8|nr:PH domain-containing protein [Microbacterium luticocti]
MARDPGRHVFRPGSAIPILGISALVVLYLLGDAVVRAGLGDALLLAPWPLLALWGVYVSAFASHLAIDDDGVTVQNLLRVVRMPWAEVTDIQWPWQVEVTTASGARVRALGGPLQGRGGRRPGTRDQTPEGVRAQYDAIVRAFDSARDRVDPGADATASGRRVGSGWDVPALVALAVLVVWAVVALVVTGGPA